MRPLKLIITGFGTYCNRTEINLEELGENGLYLITGDTGAGKTTIFDAISYALFGEVNGVNRNTSMLRSTFATPDIPTEVELTFEYKNKIYTVKRNPEYERRAKRGDGLTTQTADAELHLPDGSVITQQSKVTAAIIELLRIDREQFSKIVMIAQGDFQKLLMESTGERTEIFRKIFKTDFYRKLQDRLSDEEKKLYNECADYKTQISTNLANVKCEKEIINLPLEEQLLQIENTISMDKKELSKVDKELEKTDKKLTEINIDLEKAEVTANNKSALEEKSAKLKIVNKSLQDANDSVIIQKEQIPMREKKEAKLAVWQENLQKYTELENKLKEIEQNNQAVENKSFELEKLSAEIEKNIAGKNALSEELKKLSEVGEKIISLNAEKEKLEERKTLVLDLQNENENLKTAEKEYAALVEDYKNAEVFAQQQESEYQKLRKIYMDEQAGILALELEDEKPCPVCGSIHHPSPAKKSEHAPSKEELDSIEKNAKNAAKDMENISLNCAEKKSELANFKKNIQSALKKLFNIQEIENIEKLILDENKKLEKELSELEVSISSEQKNIDRKENLEKEIPELENQIEEERKSSEKLGNEITGLKTSIQKDEALCKELKAKLEFEDKKTATTAINLLAQDISNMKRYLDEAQEKYNNFEKMAEGFKGEIAQLEKALENAVEADLEKLQDLAGGLQKEKEEISAKHDEIISRLQANTQSFENIKSISKELLSNEEKLKWVSSLSKTANGMLSNGKEKIKLETYIQMTYFDRIINFANKRFMIMSDGQYELVRRKDAENLRSQTGLELDVIDHYNGGQRSVKSLSGGESFEASLALALGLSDEVRHSSGGIKIDTMFVDEGFGTLDSESLQKAFKALSSITEGNRLVGIISHVDLLKEKIDRQIVVKKQRTGGSTVQIIV